MKNRPQVCVAGCGRMGQPMLAALLNAGISAQGFDIRAPETYGPFSEHMTDQVQVLPPDTAILISVVRDIPQTDSLFFGEQNLLNHLKSLEYLVISSTLSPNYIKELRGKISPLTLIDAPVSGAAVAAKKARLTFMLGGESKDLAQLEPLFHAIGAHFHHMGPTGAGMAAKVLNNLIAASSTAMTRLALDWAEDAGLDSRAFLDLVHSSSGQNWFASGFEDIEFSRHGFAPDNTIGILKKDVESALDAAPENADTALPQAVLRQISNLKPR